MKKAGIIAALRRYRERFPEDNALTEDFITFAINARKPSSYRHQQDHLTVSCKLLDIDFTHELLINHRKLGMWLPPGGHLEENDVDLKAAIVREVYEETHLSNLHFLSDELWKLEKHEIGSLNPVSRCRFHYDVRFIAVVDRSEIVSLSEEALGSKWQQLQKLQRTEVLDRLHTLMA